MDIILNIIILFFSLNFFIQLFLLFLLFLLFFVCYLQIFFIKKYENEVLFFDFYIKNKKINFFDIYSSFMNENVTKIGLSNIFLIGFKEFIKLNRTNITDFNLIVKFSEKAMLNVALYFIEKLIVSVKKIFFISQAFLYIGLILTFILVFDFLSHIYVVNFIKVNSPVFIFALTEILILLFCFLLIAFIINIIYYKYLLVIYKISNKYILFINEFLIILFNKLLN